MTDPQPEAVQDWYAPRFSPAERARRSTAVRELLGEHDLPGMIIYGNGRGVGPVHYLTDYLAYWPTWLFVTADGERSLMLYFRNHAQCATELADVTDVTCFMPDQTATVPAKARALGLAHGRIGICNGGAVPAGVWRAIHDALPDVQFVDLTGAYNALRWRRSQEEIERMRIAAALADDACSALAAGITVGRTEFDAQRLIHDAFLPRGGRLGISFVSSTSMEHPDKCAPWPITTGRTIGSGDVINTELTVDYWGYGGQIQRPFAVGRPPTPLFRALFDCAARCYEAVRERLVPGATPADVAEGESIVRRAGFRLYDSLLHGEGGLNPEIGGADSGHPATTWSFEDGQVMVIQPNPATPDLRAGVQVGSAVRVTAGGAVSLHEHPMVFHVCDAGR